MAYINDSDCVQMLETKLGSKDFELEHYKIVPFEEILGFHGNHALLKIDATVGGEKHQYSFFVKTATNNAVVMERYWGRAKFFLKEHLMMSKVIKDLQKHIRRKITAECYLSKLNKFIVMENLVLAGYETSRAPEMDMIHAKEAIQAFADLHAASIIYEETTGTKINDKYPDICYENFFYFIPGYETECLTYAVDKSLRETIFRRFYQDLDKDEAQKILEWICEASVRLVKPSKMYRNVVCHGDPWGNNVLYKYKNDLPSEAILVDFQALRYVPPALEVIQFLYLSTSSAFRKKHGDELKEIYFEQLTKSLKLKDIDVEDVLPKKVFQESCEYYEEFGVVARVYYTLITRIPGEYLLRVAESEDSFLSLMIHGTSPIPAEAFEKHSGYRNLLSESINDAIEFYKTDP